jgi:hypothetical protein
LRIKRKITILIAAAILICLAILIIVIGCKPTPTQLTSTSLSTLTSFINTSEKDISGKYTEYVSALPIEPGPIHGPWIDLQGKYFDNANCRFIYRFITKPVDMVPFAHSHDFDEFMMFCGSVPEDISEFKAEIECYIGELNDREKFIIKSPTVLYFPKGVPHCPLNFNKVEETITMIIIALTPSYEVPNEGH